MISSFVSFIKSTGNPIIVNVVTKCNDHDHGLGTVDKVFISWQIAVILKKWWKRCTMFIGKQG